MFGVLIPVGPGHREAERLCALVAELARHESPSNLRLWIIDDAPEARALKVDWPEVVIIRTPLRESRWTPDVLSAHVAGTLEGLVAMRDAGMSFAVKLDTDVAVIGTFSQQLEHVFARDHRLGVVGSYDIDSNGDRRDWSMWRAPLRGAHRRISVRRTPAGIRFFAYSAAQRRHVWAQRAAAFANAPVGAHCIGGAYAVSDVFLERAALDPAPWLGRGLGEDVVIGLLASAAGLTMQSLTAMDEPFALAWKGLPATPEDIARNGHALVHSVKADTSTQEANIRGRLQAAASGASRQIH